MNRKEDLKILSDSVEIIDLTEELEDKLLEGKKINVKECYFIEKAKHVVIIANLENSFEEHPSLSTTLSIRFLPSSRPKLFKTIFLDETNKKDYLEILKKHYSEDEMMLFYHADESKEIQDARICVSYLPNSSTKVFGRNQNSLISKFSNTTEPCSRKANNSMFYAIAGSICLFGAWIGANELNKTTILERIIDTFTQKAP